jgi:hypothetical protein
MSGWLPLEELAVEVGSDGGAFGNRDQQVVFTLEVRKHPMRR